MATLARAERRLGADAATGEVNPWLIAFTVMLATFMEVLDTSVANVALPHIAGSLSATPEEATWVLTAYLVANAIVLPMSGWFSSLFGRKRFYLTCVFLFTISSALCGMAPGLAWLIVFRIMQGLGGGALQPIAQAIMRESFPRERQGMAMAVYGMGVVFAPVIGPTLGGWITDNFTWRWIFLINIPVGALALVLNSALIQDPPYLDRRKPGAGMRLDYVGFGLLVTGLGFLEYTLDEGQRKDWFSSHLITASAILSAASLVAAVIWELKQRDPIVDLRLLKDRNFAISTLNMFALGFILYASTTAMPLFMQTMLGYTATQSGLALSPGGLVIMFMMPVVGMLLSRVEARWLVIFGLLVASLGLFMMTRWNLGIAFGNAVGARMVQSAGLAFLFVPINTIAFYYIAREKTSYATGIINLARNIGGSVGIALFTTLLARREQYHQQVLASHVTPFDPQSQSALHGMSGALIQRGLGAPEAAAKAYGMLYGTLQQQSAMLAFIDVFYFLAITFLAIAPLMLLIRKMKPQKDQPIAAH
ncbi:MAG TPA: DHA2 family efflux MFS transporter permease subunit [Bryobacteraceae bacterium]|nr:DHA2 family efflux MFS transporter permease subunit [Bryobacteraceae bacterium]